MALIILYLGFKFFTNVIILFFLIILILGVIMLNKSFIRNILIVLVLAVVLIFVIKSISSKDSTQTAFEVLKGVETATQLTPLISTEVKDLTMADAYKIQKLLVENSGKEVYGFKAALTSTGAQKKFGLSSPLSGVLLETGALSKNAKIKAADFVDLKIETELAFVVGKDIDNKITQADLENYIDAVAPVIELPSLRFDNMQIMQPIDLAAANSGSNKFILGDTAPYKDLDINSIQVDMFLNGEKIYTASATEVMQDQRKALLWLINSLVEQGWNVKKDALILTGALGKVLPAKAGIYTGKWSNLGAIEFEIE